MFFVTIFYQTSMTSDPVISDLAASARAAQHGYEKFDQSQVDDVVAAIAWTVIEPARNRHLSQRAVQDTGLGNVAPHWEYSGIKKLIPILVLHK